MFYTINSCFSLGVVMSRFKKFMVCVSLSFLMTGSFVGSAFSEDYLIQDEEYVVFDPVIKDSSITIDSNDVPPVEPNIIKNPFYKIPELSAVEQRIDRLLQGITIDIPPEYDHYGYEIRRYMAHVGNVKIYEDDKRLIEELANVKKSRVIMSYWQKALDKEIRSIDDLIAEKPITPAMAAKYKQNKSTVRSFLVALQGWLDSNDRFMTRAYQNSAIYENYYPDIVFINQGNEAVDFYNDFLLKQTKLKVIRRYTPFAIMVY